MNQLSAPESKESSFFQRIFNLLLRVSVGVGMVVLLFWYFGKSYVYIDSIRQIYGTTMGTEFCVKSFTGQTNAQWKKVENTVQGELDRIDGMMSTYKPDSEVSKFNAQTSTDWFPVSPEMIEVIALSKEASQLTGGMFDITVGPLVDLWGFGSKHPKPTTIPSDEEIHRVQSYCGIEKLEVQTKPPAIRKTVPELQIDLSAIAKGYAVDCVAEKLENLGVKNYMVEVGGETKTHGKKKHGAPWLIGIREPKFDVNPMMQPTISEAVNVGNQALATSGDYMNFTTLDGKRFAHIIDPRTGWPTEMTAENAPLPKEQLGSISVIDPSCARADALATGLFVIGSEKGVTIANEQKIPVLYLIRTENKKEPIKKIASEPFEKGKYVNK